MTKIFLWGTGQIAEDLWKQCETLSQYEILGFIDNDFRKQGEIFKGLNIYSPKILEQCTADYIVILSEAYEEIYLQIVNTYPEMGRLIQNKNFFYKESLFKRYKGTTNPEIIKVLKYIEKYGLDIFNYEFTEKYKNVQIETDYDCSKKMYYIKHAGKYMYFSRALNTEKKVIDYYRNILLEQDIHSPHRYITDEFNISKGDVVVDIGAAEGNFSIEIIDKVSKLYIIESDADWIDALKETFKNDREKVVIIQKFISSFDDGKFARLDSLIHEPVNFIKMDIEGNEWDGLQGGEKLIKASNRLKCAICCYHSDFDQTLIENFMNKYGLEHCTSGGYMWFPWTIRQNYVSTRLNRAVIRGMKCGN